MKVPYQLVFRNMRGSDSLRTLVSEKVIWLETFSSKVVSCRVLVEKPHRRHRKGNLYHVRIDLRLPGEELIINRTPELHHRFKDVYVSIHDAFDRARREVEEYERKKRRDVKFLSIPSCAFIIALYKEDDRGEFGFIRSEDGREIYFHRNALINETFDSLRIGMKVRYHEQLGEKGPQASSIEVLSVGSKEVYKVA